MRVRVLSTSGIVLLALLLPPLAAEDARFSPDGKQISYPPVGGQADDPVGVLPLDHERRRFPKPICGRRFQLGLVSGRVTQSVPHEG